MRFPVSFSQQRLWFLDQLAPGEPTYNMPYGMWLDGPLDAQALQRAMDALVAHQSVFRTSIVAFDGVPEQVIAAKPAADYDSKVQEAGTTRDRFIGQLYAELKPPK